MITLNKKIELKGTSLMDGKESIVKLVPAEKKGIYFYPANSDIKIEAKPQNVISTQHCTVLGNARQHIKLVEHFMAACAFAGIQGINVYISSNELPIFDGSSKVWLQEFKKAGLTNQESTQMLEIKKSVYFQSGSSNVAILPADNFKITYCVNFDHKDYINKWYSWDHSKSYEEIVEARTFGYLRDLEKFQQAGFSLGVTKENTIGLTDDGGYTTELRSDMEPIKHKILDLIGDLYLTGINPLNLKANIVAMLAGHTIHVETAKKLMEEMR